MAQRTSRDDIIRQFWAAFLGSKVAKDGQVAGFDKAWREMRSAERLECDRFAHWCAVKIERDGRDPEECIASGVSELKRTLQSLPAPAPDCPPSRASFYTAVLGHMWSASKVPTAAELADWLESEAWPDCPADFQQILRLLRAWQEEMPFPPLPSMVDAAAAATGKYDPRWWTPGTRPGGWQPYMLAAIDSTIASTPSLPVSGKAESDTTPTSGELLEAGARASLEVSLFPEPDQE